MFNKIILFRQNEDVPSQSDVLPLINVYFHLCMLFSLSAMIWFSIINKLKEKKYLPKKLQYLIVYFFSTIFTNKTTKENLIKYYELSYNFLHKGNGNTSHSISSNMNGIRLSEMHKLTDIRAYNYFKFFWL